jgi:hypothetical protein
MNLTLADDDQMVRRDHAHAPSPGCRRPGWAIRCGHGWR